MDNAHVLTKEDFQELSTTLRVQDISSKLRNRKVHASGCFNIEGLRQMTTDWQFYCFYSTERIDEGGCLWCLKNASRRMIVCVRTVCVCVCHA